MNEFRPLQGIRVLDFTHVIAGPMATFYLTQFGADVTKVENARGGDVMRRGHGSAAGYVALNAGKHHLTLDLSDHSDRAHALRLAAEADVLVDSLRPGVLDAFGLGAEAMRAAHPRLIYCAISGYGREGEWQRRPAYDHVVQAATGMAMMGGREGDPPIKTGFPVVDSATGIVGALAIVSALMERQRTGLGRFLDVSMSAAAMQLMYPFACNALTQGQSPPRVGNQAYSGSPAADFFECRDGWFALGANTARQLAGLLEALGHPEIAQDPEIFEAPAQASGATEFLRAKNPQRLKQLLADLVRERSGAELEAACAEHNVPASRVRTIAQYASDATTAQAQATLELHDLDTRVLSPGLGFRVS